MEREQEGEVFKANTYQLIMEISLVINSRLNNGTIKRRKS